MQEIRNYSKIPAWAPRPRQQEGIPACGPPQAAGGVNTPPAGGLVSGAHSGGGTAPEAGHGQDACRSVGSQGGRTAPLPCGRHPRERHGRWYPRRRRGGPPGYLGPRTRTKRDGACPDRCAPRQAKHLSEGPRPPRRHPSDTHSPQRHSPRRRGAAARLPATAALCAGAGQPLPKTGRAREPPRAGGPGRWPPLGTAPYPGTAPSPRRLAARRAARGSHARRGWAPVPSAGKAAAALPWPLRDSSRSPRLSESGEGMRDSGRHRRETSAAYRMRELRRNSRSGVSLLSLGCQTVRRASWGAWWRLSLRAGTDGSARPVEGSVYCRLARSEEELSDGY